MMTDQKSVLVLGGTGRTGRKVLEQLLGRGVRVTAIVRSRSRLPEGLAAEPGLTVVEADVSSIGEEDLLPLVRGCDAVVSCLGHTTNLAGIFGPPRDLVTKATERICRTVESACPERPVRFILMSSVSVNHPEAAEARRGGLDRLALWLLRGLIPPTGDNQRAADYLCRTIGRQDPHMAWVAVRPDTLLEGDRSEYALHETINSSLLKPDKTNRANVACFMCDLATDPDTWSAWAGRLPVIVNSSTPAG